jgi:hypothetical protein
MARAMAPKTDMAQNTGIMSVAPQATATPEEPQQMAHGGMVRKMRDGRSVNTFPPEVFTDNALRAMASREGKSVQQWLNSMDPSVASNYAQGAVARADRERFTAMEPVDSGLNSPMQLIPVNPSYETPTISRAAPTQQQMAGLDRMMGTEPPTFTRFTPVNPSYEEPTTSVFPDDNQPEVTGLAIEPAPLYPPMPAGNPIPGVRPEGGFYDQPYQPRLSPMELLRQRMAVQDRMMGTEPPVPAADVVSPMDRIRERMRLEEAQQRQRDFARDRMMGMEPPLPKAVPEVEKARAEGRESFTLGELLGDYGVTVGLGGTGAQAVPGPGRGAVPAANAAADPMQAEAQKSAEEAARLRDAAGITESLKTPEEVAAAAKAARDAVSADTPSTPPGGDGDGGDGGGGGSGGGGGVGGSFAAAGPQTDYEKAIADALARNDKRAVQDKWMAIAQAGLALMSSNSPTLAGALGEAGAAGLGAFQSSRDEAEKTRMGLLGTQYEMDMAKQKMAMARAGGGGGGLTAYQMYQMARNERSDELEQAQALQEYAATLDPSSAAYLDIQAQLADFYGGGGAGPAPVRTPSAG